MWCAVQSWLGRAAAHSADLAGALAHYTAVCDAIGDRGPSQALADCLADRSETLVNLGRIAEAAKDGRRALALAREVGYPAGEALALTDLSIAAKNAGDLGGAVRLARQAEQITADIPGQIARSCSRFLAGVLITAGELAAAERPCASALARSRDAGDLRNLAALLARMPMLDLRAGRTGDAAAHLREALQITERTGRRFELYNMLDGCGNLCAATGRWAEAVTVWAACAALSRQEGPTDAPAFARRRDEALREAWQVLGPDRARAAEDRGAAMSLATAAEYALMLTAPGPRGRGAGPGAAQYPGTGAGHPGRPGPHQRPDRRPVVHQRPHRRLAPGPDPGQDRLPPPRRPDPPGPDRGPGLGQPGGPGLARPAACLPRAPGRCALWVI